VGRIDPLSPRELDVLRPLGSAVDGPDIARELFVSGNTVRSHTKNVYTKLGMTNRRAAVRRGEELDLMSRHRDRRSGRADVWQDTGRPSGSLSGADSACSPRSGFRGSPHGSPHMVIRSHHRPSYVPSHRCMPDRRP